MVFGIRHPLPHSRGLAIKELRQHGLQVDVLGEAACFEDMHLEESVIHQCLAVNEVGLLPQLGSIVAWQRQLMLGA